MAIWKNSPVNLRVYGIAGNPAGPTEAPIGRFAASASVAGTVVDGGVDAEEELVELEEVGVPEDEEDGLEEDEVESVDAAAAGSVVGAADVVFISPAAHSLYAQMRKHGSIGG